jgi:hypothetical protein
MGIVDHPLVAVCTRDVGWIVDERSVARVRLRPERAWNAPRSGARTASSSHQKQRSRRDTMPVVTIRFIAALNTYEER